MVPVVITGVVIKHQESGVNAEEDDKVSSNVAKDLAVLARDGGTEGPIKGIESDFLIYRVLIR